MKRLRTVNKNSFNRVLKAIRFKRNSKAKSMLSKAMCNSVVLRSGTLLHWAARHGNAMIARYLIELGCEVNRFDANFTTPLMLAVQAKSRATVEVLLKAGAEVNYVDNEEFSALETVFFINNFHPGVGRAFLCHLRRRTSTPQEYAKKLANACCSLYHAVHFGDIDLIESLIRIGRGINAQGYRMRTALHAAVELCDDGLVKWILNKSGDVNVADDRHLTPLHYLYKRNCEFTIERLKILNILIEKGAKLTQSSRSGYPQMTSIIKYGCEEAIRMLLRCGVDLNSKIERDNKALLHLVAENDWTHVGQTLERVKDLKVNVLDRRGRCPLFIAATRGNPIMVKFLLSQGADPNISGKYNPLVGTFAAQLLTQQSEEHLYECAWLLLQSGADPQLSISVTKKIFYYASKYGFNFNKIRMIVAHLALMEMLGTRIFKRTHEQIRWDPRLQMYYRSCRRLLRAKIFGSLTIIDFQKLSDSKMKIHLRNERFIKKVTRIGRKYRLRMTFSYYYEILQRRIAKLAYTMKLEFGAAVTLKHIFNRYHSMSQLIVQFVMVYFNKQDLKRLCKFDISNFVIGI